MTEREEEHRVDYTTVREDWSEYKTNDGTSVKVKLTLTELIEIGQRTGKFKFGIKGIMFKQPTPDDMPKPDEKQDDEEKVETIEFTKVRDSLNIYDVPERFLFLNKPKLEKLEKTNKFNSKGKRIWKYLIGCAINIVKYPDEKSEKLEAVKKEY